MHDYANTDHGLERAFGRGSIGNANAPLNVERDSVTQDVAVTVGEVGNLHSNLDELEMRLFGPEPRQVGDTQPGAGQQAASIATACRVNRNAIEHANSRLMRIISRL